MKTPKANPDNKGATLISDDEAPVVKKSRQKKPIDSISESDVSELDNDDDSKSDIPSKNGKKVKVAKSPSGTKNQKKSYVAVHYKNVKHFYLNSPFYNLIAKYYADAQPIAIAEQHSSPKLIKLRVEFDYS